MPKGLGPLDRKLWGAFCVADLDGSGAISRKELAYAFRLAGLTSTTAEKRAVFREADLNRDGVLTRTRTRTRTRARTRTRTLTLNHNPDPSPNPHPSQAC